MLAVAPNSCFHTFYLKREFSFASSDRLRTCVSAMSHTNCLLIIDHFDKRNKATVDADGLVRTDEEATAEA